MSYLELWWLLCSVERNNLRNFDRMHHKEQFCEIILNLDQGFRRCHLKDFLSRALVALVVSGAEPFMLFRRRASCETINVHVK